MQTDDRGRIIVSTLASSEVRVFPESAGICSGILHITQDGDTIALYDKARVDELINALLIARTYVNA